jgi:hypothetical protein
MKMTMMRTTSKIIYKAGIKNFGFFILLALISFGCNSEEKLTADQIVTKAIETHGGIENWKEVKQVSFDKETTLLLEDGSIQIKTEQFQLFQFKPQLFAKIEWEMNGEDHLMIYEDGKVSKRVNDSIITSTEDLDRAESAVFAAQYVISQPFDLLNENVTLTYLGVEEIEDKQAHVIAVNYDGDDNNSDKWSYYVDVETFEIVANKVELTDHTSWVENLTFDTETDFKFNAHRKSYRLNEAGEKTYLRAEYFYTNFSVQY